MCKGMRMRLAPGAVLTAGAVLLAGCSTVGVIGFADEPIVGEDQGWDGPAEANIERMEFDELIDGVRVGNDRGTLAMDDRLNQASQDYAAVQAELGPEGLSHTGPDGSGPDDRARAAGYEPAFIAEALAYGPTSNEVAMEAWMASPSHRESVLDPRAEDFGLGREGVTWVLMLGSEG
jgi:uncharacterized protein YkwD